MDGNAVGSGVGVVSMGGWLWLGDGMIKGVGKGLGDGDKDTWGDVRGATDGAGDVEAIGDTDGCFTNSALAMFSQLGVVKSKNRRMVMVFGDFIV